MVPVYRYTGDLLTGEENSSMGTLMDSLYEVWNQDPVHGERQAYTRIGLALLKHINMKGRVGAYIRGSVKNIRTRMM